MKKLHILLALSIFVLLSVLLHAEISKTTHIQDAAKEISPNTLVLFNIAEVLMDTETSLGSQAWRKYVRTRVDSQTHDKLTLFVFQNVPPKAPEPKTPKLIKQLQKQGIVVLAFTSRGRHEWYATQMPEIDLITEKMLQTIGIDCGNTQINDSEFPIKLYFEEFFHNGIIYATNSLEKGELLANILEVTNYKPEKIVFIDDKLDSLQSVESALQPFGIPFHGFAYSRTSLDHANFDPMIANIQLDWLISFGKVLSDKQAAKINKEKFAGIDHDEFFLKLLLKWKSKSD